MTWKDPKQSEHTEMTLCDCPEAYISYENSMRSYTGLVKFTIMMS